MSLFQLLNGITFAALLFVVAAGFTLMFAALHLKAMRNEIWRRRLKALQMAEVARAQAVAAAWNDQRVLVPHDAPWLREFVDEVGGFTGVSDKADDQVDGLGLQRLSPRERQQLELRVVLAAGPLGINADLGQVADAGTKALATQLASGVPGVQSVENQMTMGGGAVQQAAAADLLPSLEAAAEERQAARLAAMTLKRAASRKPKKAAA